MVVRSTGTFCASRGVRHPGNDMPGGGVAPFLAKFSGAAAAYSLRQLNNDGNFNVVKVRRGSDDTVRDFTAGEVANGTLGLFIGAGDGFVEVWYDQSGNGLHAAQPVTSKQPKIANNGSIITAGGVAAIDFDGVSDWLATSGYMVELSANTDVQIAIVYGSAETPSATNYVLVESDLSEPYYSSQFIVGSIGSQSDVLWVNADVFGTAPPTRYLAGFQKTGANGQAYVNGAVSGASAALVINSEVGDATYIGASANGGATAQYQGTVQELIVYHHNNNDITRYATEQVAYYNL